MVKAQRFSSILACGLLMISGGFSTVACSTFTKKSNSYANVQFKRSWSRQTTEATYLGHRQPATISPVVSKDLVVSGNGIDGIHAFDRKLGNRRWKMPLKQGSESVFLDSETGVYLGANNGNFYHVNSENGAVVWTYSVGSESAAAPLVRGGYVYHMTMNGTLFALEKESGRVLWVKTRPPKDPITVRGTTPPVFFDGKIVVGYSDGYLMAYNAVDGSVVWERSLGESKKFNDVDTKPTITDQCILVANFSDALFCVDKVNGQVRWQLNEGGSAQPVQVAGNDIVFSGESSISIVDLGSGKLKKRFNIDKRYGIPTAAIPYKSWVVFGLSDGPLVLMERESGKWVDTFAPGRGISAAPTVIAETGEIFFVSNQANVYKLQIDRSDRRKSYSLAGDR